MTSTRSFRAAASFVMALTLFTGASVIAQPDAEAATTKCTSWVLTSGIGDIRTHCVTVGDPYVDGKRICVDVSWSTTDQLLIPDPDGLAGMGPRWIVDEGTRTDCY